jgi:triosephosphate isomerase
LWIGTSWKMNKTIREACEYARVLAAASLPDGIQPFILPPHTALAAVRDVLPSGTRVLLGAQNAHWASEGAGTGEVSMRMVADAGARLVEMGHSERREQFGETDETVAHKARAAVDHGLTPLICVGEPGDVRADGDAEKYVSSQVEAALSELNPAEVAGVLVAYEPIWAIGIGGRPATSGETAPIMAAVSQLVLELSGGTGCTALLYGGSVHRDNVLELLADPHTDGLFVGRAAWDAEGYLELLALARRHLDKLGA